MFSTERLWNRSNQYANIFGRVYATLGVNARATDLRAKRLKQLLGIYNFTATVHNVVLHIYTCYTESM